MFYVLTDVKSSVVDPELFPGPEIILPDLDPAKNERAEKYKFYF